MDSQLFTALACRRENRFLSANVISPIEKRSWLRARARSLGKLITIPEAVRNLCPARLISVKFSLIPLVCTVSFIPKDKLDSPTKGYNGVRERERELHPICNAQEQPCLLCRLAHALRTRARASLDNNFVSFVRSFPPFLCQWENWSTFLFTFKKTPHDHLVSASLRVHTVISFFRENFSL